MITPGINRIGTTLRLNVVFQDSAGANIDPESVVAQTCNPSGGTLTYTYGSSDELGTIGTGQYYLDMTPTEGGRWFIRWLGTSLTNTVAIEDDFIVQTSPFVASALGDYA